MNTRQVVPPTRLGLVLSIAGFAVAATLMASDTARVALGRPYGLAWIVLVVLMVYPPRMIRVGNGWARQRCRAPLSTILYASGVVVALGGTTWALSGGAPAAVVTGMATLAIAGIAATLPAATERPRPSATT